MVDRELELSLVRLIPSRERARWRYLLERDSGRQTFIGTLYHGPPFDERYVDVLEGADRRADAIERNLRARGAPAGCYVVSTRWELDARSMPLSEALRTIVDENWESVVVCVPGRLAYYEGEAGAGGEYQWIVERSD